ncbi:MAG: RNA 2',3'-cyclic phosphodiesterase [Alphaproteobacteria bacterium]|nr:RNA 2',3'-cyclic phosphodiesterase [Alphaproteobacteria bacterium]
MRRLFIALAMPPPVREQLAAVQCGLDGARWVDPDSAHMTLRFVGEVDEGVAEDLAAALTGVRSPAFSLELAGIGHFERRGRPSAVWAGVVPNPALDIVHHRVEAAVRRAGVPSEGRKFTPHVTLARFGSNISSPAVAHWIAQAMPFHVEPFPVTEVALFRSRLGHAGPSYTPEQVYLLDRLPDADSVADLWREGNG